MLQLKKQIKNNFKKENKLIQENNLINKRNNKSI